MKKDSFRSSDFSYELPKNLIAQEPVNPRDSSRLLVVDRKAKSIKEVVFRDIINFFNEDDILVLNDTRVIKAKLEGSNKNGAKIEVLLVKEKEHGIWEALVKPGRRARPGNSIVFTKEGLSAEILDKTAQGGRVLKFSPPDFAFNLEHLGQVPLPSYIKKDIDDPEKYQTVYSKKQGAIAAPTAGLHFTPELIKKIESKGTKIIYVTLHCGLATFRPLKCEDIKEHKMDYEWVDISQEAAVTINNAKNKMSRIIGIGTTSVRSLESAAFLDARVGYQVKSGSFETNLYITPGYKFKMVDILLTNFHTPLSTNLILVSAFAGAELIRKAYEYAKSSNFRFFSFGDAMLIL